VTREAADCHNDLLMAVRHRRERGELDPFGDFWLPQFRAGNVRLQVLPICTEEQFVGEGALRRCLTMIDEVRHIAETHSDSVVVALTAEELRAGLSDGRLVLVLAIEGAEPVGHSLEVLNSLARLGVRMMSLSWNRRTMMADGVGERDTGGRLTTLGVEAVGRMEELGVVVDVSHLSQQGFYHLADIATRPFIASHSSCRAVTDHPRNLDDDQLTAVRELGGMVCINAFGPFISDTSPTVESFVDHVEHAVTLMGAASVGLGTDFIRDVTTVVDPIFSGLLVPADSIPWTLGLERPEDFPMLAAALEARLGPDTADAVMSRNLMNFLGSQLP
jgi:membrane dipeptidase